MAQTNYLSAVLLLFSTVAGIYCLYGLGFTPDGVMRRLSAIITSSAPIWPGTSAPLKKTFTTIPFIDGVLYNLNPFFAHVVDGSNPSLSLYSIFFLGQYAAAIGLCYLESIRSGNQGRAISFVTVWFTVVQLVGFAVLFPIYLLTHVLTSPFAKSHTAASNAQVIAPLNKLRALPLALTIGYLIPSSLIYLPTDASTRQNLLSTWQVFPTWTFLSLTIFSALISSPTSSAVQAHSTRKHITQLNRVYGFLFFLAAATYLTTLLLICYPSIPAPYLPQVARSLLTREVTLSSVFLPYAPLLSWRAKDLADGVHVFLWWDAYVSATAAFIWAFTLLKAANGSVVRVLPGVILASLLAGPFGGVVWLVWERDVLALKAGGANKRE